MQNCMTEFSLRSARAYDDPFNEVELGAAFTGPDGVERLVPAFWRGEGTWTVRYASSLPGRHTYRTVCSNPGDADLHGREGVVEVSPYAGENVLLERGPLRVSEDGRRLEHVDGTPFFWLGDTWWMGLCRRLGWPDEFQALTADRVEKGFTLIQIVAGLYPDMGPLDERGAGEAGFPWEADFARINPAYFDAADRRIEWLVRCGLVPCIVACWGYYMRFAGPEVLRKHWRYLVARWGAFPVVWCLAGEVLMPWYLDRFEAEEAKDEFIAHTQEDWKGVARHLRAIDPYRHPLSAHPGGEGPPRGWLGEDLLDVEMLQTGHGGFASVPNTVRQVTGCVARQPRMPVINGEVSYEGIGGTCWQDVQRLMFWGCMLSGAAGHTYGANGLWQLNSREHPYGPSPYGMTWGNMPWQDAYRLPGSRQVGIGRRLLERYEWWRLEPAPDCVEGRWTAEDYFGHYAARIPGQCTIVYIPRAWGPVVLRLEQAALHRTFFFNPATGEEYDVGQAAPDADGRWASPEHVPIYQDLVLVAERTRA